MSQFVADTAVHRIDDERWGFTLHPQWRIGAVPNGGYVLALAGRVLSEALPHRDPLTVNACYVAPTEPGEGEATVEVLRTGGRSTQAELRLYQGGTLRVLVTAVFCDLDELQGENWQREQAPAFAPAVEGTPHRARHFHLQERVNVTFMENEEVFHRGKPNGSGQWNIWLSFTDGAPIDPIGLLCLADVCPPPIFTVVGPVTWVPTLDLSVQVRARPAPGPLRAQMNSRFLTEGVVEEDGRYWDSSDTLIALSRQTAKIRVPPEQDWHRRA